jgi:RNA recognition motif-containing protein
VDGLEVTNLDSLLEMQQSKIAVQFPEKENPLFYEKLQDSLKNITLDVYVKGFVDCTLTSLRGTITQVDKNGKYLVLEEKNKGKDFIYFHRIEDAILAIRDEHGSILYKNTSVINEQDLMLRTQEDVNCFRERGLFNAELFKYNPIFIPKINYEKKDDNSNQNATLHVA